METTDEQGDTIDSEANVEPKEGIAEDSRSSEKVDGSVDDADQSKVDGNVETETGSEAAITIEENVPKSDDAYTNEISIDPRTYCKLGHFHLLLEDYAKGQSINHFRPGFHRSGNHLI